MLCFGEEKGKSPPAANINGKRKRIVATLDDDQQTIIDLSLRFFTIHANK
ncbi:hypothetical protein [Parageobacillus thermoglucosidasius]|nr:hypothetical protein [Parageobacillus thermoglucosidasius]KYD17126.1 hypothetical protein B4168_1526 [Anoxybacillus flavithermus]OAO84181.1 hypothetical protein GT23_3716 [Parageobacillus thermoglucosidasius]